MASIIHEVTVIGASIVETIFVPPSLSSVRALGALEIARDCSNNDDILDRDTGTQSEGSASSPDSALSQQQFFSASASNIDHGTFTSPCFSYSADNNKLLAITMTSDNRKCQWKSRAIAKVGHESPNSTCAGLSAAVGGRTTGVHHSTKCHTQPLFPGAYAAKLRTHRQAASDLSCLFKSIKDQ